MSKSEFILWLIYSKINSSFAKVSALHFLEIAKSCNLMKIDIFCQPSIVDYIFKMCPEPICFSSSSSSSQITIFTCLDHCTSCIYLTATILSPTVYSSLAQCSQVNQSMLFDTEHVSKCPMASHCHIVNLPKCKI